MYHRAKLKQETKQAMSATRPRPIWIAMLFTVIVSAGSGILNALLSAVTGLSALQSQFVTLLQNYGNDLSNIELVLQQMFYRYANQIGSLVTTLVLSSVITSLLTALWSALMQVGFDGYCLDMVSGRKTGVARLFCGFPMIGKVVLTGLLVWVFTTLWTLLFVVCLFVIVFVGGLLMNSVPALGIIIMVVGYIAFLVMVIRVNLRYAMSYYVLLDTGKYGLDAVTGSKVMMKGNKGKLFVLQLSFIGWLIIEGLIVSIPMMILFAAAGIMAVSGASVGAVIGLGVAALILVVLASVGMLFYSSWLYSYMGGALAKFYLFFKGNDPQECLPNE